MVDQSKSLLKRAALEVAQRSGFNAVVRRVFRKRLVVLCYHSIISDDAPLDPRANIAVSKSQFELQLRELVQHFEPVAFEQVMSACYEARELPARAVLVTFDDGYRNNLELAAPMLLQYKIPAIFFVTTGFINSTRLLWAHEIVERVVHWPDYSDFGLLNGSGPLPRNQQGRLHVAAQIVELNRRRSLEDRGALLEQLRSFDLPTFPVWKRELYQFMTWDDVRSLSQLGFEIGAHTVDHPILSSLAHECAQKQICDSKETIEAEIGRECNAIAYPYGGANDFSDEVLHQAALAGFKLGFTLGNTAKWPPVNPLAIDRICITRDISFRRFQARISGL